MATSSILGIDPENIPSEHSATGIDRLGPSDASDSGSDSAGVYSADSDTDRFGTGERSSADPAPSRSDRDILPDHVENAAGDEDTSRSDEGALTAEDLPRQDDDDNDDSDETANEER